MCLKKYKIFFDISFTRKWGPVVNYLRYNVWFLPHSVLSLLTLGMHVMILDIITALLAHCRTSEHIVMFVDCSLQCILHKTSIGRNASTGATGPTATRSGPHLISPLSLRLWKDCNRLICVVRPGWSPQTTPSVCRPCSNQGCDKFVSTGKRQCPRFCKRLLICIFHSSFSSSTTPRYLMDETRFTAPSSVKTAKKY